MERWGKLANPYIAIAVGLGLIAWWLLDPPHLTGAANAARAVSAAFGAFLLAYGLSDLAAEWAGGRSPRRSLQWPLVIGFCALVVFNVATYGQREERQMEQAIDAGVADLNAWEARQAARWPVQQFIGHRAGARGSEACGHLTPRLIRELLADFGSEAGGPDAQQAACAKLITEESSRSALTDPALSAFQGADVWVALEAGRTDADRAEAGPEFLSYPSMDLRRIDGTWLIDGVTTR